MIGLEQVRNRLRLLEDRARPIQAEIDSLAAGPETPERTARYNELAQALMVMVGRRMECEAWIEMLMAYPGVMRPDQLPTKANTPAYAPITETLAPQVVARSREQLAQRDSAELITLLPDAD